MIPTLMPGDRVLVAKFWYHFTEPKRGQIVVFKYPLDPTRDFVKRLIALPGDAVEIKNGVVYIDDVPLEEPYVKNRDFFSMEKITVPNGQYFVMGDNRPNSQDSRFWGFVPKTICAGRLFPLLAFDRLECPSNARTVWYPTMEKGKRQLKEMASQVDVFIEVRDARAPKSASSFVQELVKLNRFAWS